MGAARVGACQTSGPDTPASRRLAELVRVIDRGDRDTLRAYAATNLAESFLDQIPLDEHVDVLSGVHARSGGLRVKRMESPEPERASALVQSKRTDEWMRVSIEVEPDSRHRIAAIMLRPAEAPRNPSARQLTDTEIVAQLRRYLDRLAREDAFSGAVLLAKNGTPLITAAYGHADKNFAVPNRVDTKFNLGSMNKMFTAVAVAQLAERGKLSFDDPIAKHLPNSLPPEVAAKVRIKHLLTHTSGLGSYFTPEWDAASRARFRTVDDFMALVKDDSLAFEPGTRWSYSNTGFLVLGKIIEQVTGGSYFDYVREHIFRPAGMINTDSYELDAVTPNLAVGYEREVSPHGPRWRNNLFQHVIKGGPAGGGYSTVEDLLRFDLALRSLKLVGKKYTDLLLSAKPEIASPEYGYGFGIRDGGRVVGHSGGFAGISSSLEMHLHSRYTIAVLSNYGEGSQPVVAKIRSLIPEPNPASASREH